MNKEERVIINGDINIGATIAYKDKSEKQPLVLLIMGTGSLDRDGNGFGFKSNLYKDMSDMFVDMGCVCIRYDKRGTHESSGDGKTSGLYDLVDDAAQVIHYAKKLDYIDPVRVVVCGHSEGAMIATLLTKSEELKGIILLGGACMSLKDASLYQNYLVLEEVKDMKGPLGWYLRKVLKKDKIDKQVFDFFDKAEKTDKPSYFYRGAILSTKYMREHLSLTKEEYVKLLKEYKGRVLALTGKSDVQADYRRLDDILGEDGITVVTPDNVNHLMRDIDGEASILNVNKDYKKVLKKEISPSVKSNIKDWMKNI